jgi:hypothetical protein
MKTSDKAVLALSILGPILAPVHAETVNFSYAGFEQIFMVPAGISTIQVSLYGAQGGGPNGGQGGASFADLVVTPGESLSIFIGGQGGFVSTTNGGTASGGFNGGGLGRTNGIGAGGGGATDIRRAGTKLIVARGGGGGSTCNGGVGGGATGGAAACGSAAGGSQTAGGVGSAPGSFGFGGAATSGSADGGGGGWFGGGAGQAGGGGSSFLASSPSILTNGATLSGINFGDGKASISYHVSVIPEPEGYLLALAALAVLGSVSTWRRRAETADR